MGQCRIVKVILKQVQNDSGSARSLTKRHCHHELCPHSPFQDYKEVREDMKPREGLLYRQTLTSVKLIMN